MSIPLRARTGSTSLGLNLSWFKNVEFTARQLKTHEVFDANKQVKHL